MHDTLPLFFKLLTAPVVGFISSSGLVVATTQINDDSTVTLGFLLATLGVVVTIFCVVGAGVWKLATTLGKLNESNQHLSAEVEQARADRGKMFEKLDDLNDEMTEVKTEFAAFSAACPAVNGDKCSKPPFAG